MRSDTSRTRRVGRYRVRCETARNELRVLLPSDPLAVRDALRSTMGGLSHLNLDAKDRANIELVLAEVLNNIVEHGYRNEPGGLIELQIAHDDTGLRCVALDDGCAMPGGQPPITYPPDPAVPVSNLDEGGFGWFLIRELSHDLSYSRDGARNRLQFSLALGRRVQTC